LVNQTVGKLSVWSEYFNLSDKETTRNDCGSRGRETNSVKEEVLSYLNERRKKLFVLKVHPRVMKVFRKYNCVIPSSASAKRLFSVGGGIFTPKRNMLRCGMFEKLLLLKGASKKLS